MELISKDLSPETKLNLGLSEGKLILGVVVDTSGMTANLSIGVDSGYFIDQLKALIPGTVDDAIFDVIKAALKPL